MEEENDISTSPPASKRKIVCYWICIFILAYAFHIITLVVLDDFKDSDYNSNRVYTDIAMVIMGTVWVLIWSRSKNKNVREDVSAKEAAQQDGLAERLIHRDEDNLQAPAPRR